MGKLSDQLLRLNNDNLHLRAAKHRYESMMVDVCTKIVKHQASHDDIVQWASDILASLKDVQNEAK